MRIWLISTLVALTGVFQGSLVHGQGVIAIGNGYEGAQDFVAVPVEVSVPGPVSALNMRIRYDPTLLSLTNVTGGPLLDPNHDVHFKLVPAADNLVSIVVYAPQGNIPFTSSSGTGLNLIFEVGEAAIPGTTVDVVFDPSVVPMMPTAGLSNPTGMSVAHSLVDGRVFLAFQASIWITPRVLNLTSEGRWITCLIELPEGLDVRDIDVASVRLNETVAAAANADWADSNENGIMDLTVKFPRAEVIDCLDGQENERIIVTGSLTGIENLFKGEDTIGTVSSSDSK